MMDRRQTTSSHHLLYRTIMLAVMYCCTWAQFRQFPTAAPHKSGFVCRSDFGHYPHPANCSRYFVCLFGEPIEKTCASPLVYSDHLETCDWPRNVRGCQPHISQPRHFRRPSSLHVAPVFGRQTGRGERQQSSSSRHVQSSLTRNRAYRRPRVQTTSTAASRFNDKARASRLLSGRSSLFSMIGDNNQAPSTTPQIFIEDLNRVVARRHQKLVSENTANRYSALNDKYRQPFRWTSPKHKTESPPQHVTLSSLSSWTPLSISSLRSSASARPPFQRFFSSSPTSPPHHNVLLFKTPTPLHHEHSPPISRFQPFSSRKTVTPATVDFISSTTVPSSEAARSVSPKSSASYMAFYNDTLYDIYYIYDDDNVHYDDYGDSGELEGGRGELLDVSTTRPATTSSISATSVRQAGTAVVTPAPERSTTDSYQSTTQVQTTPTSSNESDEQYNISPEISTRWSSPVEAATTYRPSFSLISRSHRRRRPYNVRPRLSLSRRKNTLTRRVIAGPRKSSDTITSDSFTGPTNPPPVRHTIRPNSGTRKQLFQVNNVAVASTPAAATERFTKATRPSQIRVNSPSTSPSEVTIPAPTLRPRLRAIPRSTEKPSRIRSHDTTNDLKPPSENEDHVVSAQSISSSTTDSTTYHPIFRNPIRLHRVSPQDNTTLKHGTASNGNKITAKQPTNPTVKITSTEPATTAAPTKPTSLYKIALVNKVNEKKTTLNKASNQSSNRISESTVRVSTTHQLLPKSNRTSESSHLNDPSNPSSATAAQSNPSSKKPDSSNIRLHPPRTSRRQKKKGVPKRLRTSLVWPGRRQPHDRHHSHKTFGLIGIPPRYNSTTSTESISTSAKATSIGHSSLPLPAVLDAGQRSLNVGSSRQVASLFPKKSTSSIKTRTKVKSSIWDYPPKRPEPLYPQPEANQPAPHCTDKCLLPDCFCGGPAIPGSLAASDTPQLVMLTFDDSINELNQPLYQAMFNGKRLNPNGCPISATFFVSHEWTNYGLVRNMYADGHEIASHTISHSHGEEFSEAKWQAEIVGQREILAAYAGIRMQDIRGMRAPFLSIGGNKMYNMLYKENFTYDSSMPVYDIEPPSWPFTLDYKIQHDCMIKPCPDKSYPGVWQIPMVMWEDLNGGRCNMVDACARPETAEQVFKMHMLNFNRHYNSNRAVFPLFFHSAWFNTAHLRRGFMAFLDHISQMDDVWLVTGWQVLQWMRDPQPLSSVKHFTPFSCSTKSRVSRCNQPRRCKLTHGTGVRHMATCQGCPSRYPWVGDTGVQRP